MDKKILIKLRNVGISYDDVKVLTNISLDITKKGMILIYGENGSGKTSILKIISGLIKPSRGIVSHIQDIDIGFIFQKPILLKRTVKENLLHTLYAANKKLTYNKANKIIDENLIRFKLEKLKDKYVMKLSGGQQQMISICRSVIIEPELLICDEPNNNLDDLNKQFLYSFLEDYSKSKKVVIVSQDKDEIMRYCNSVYNVKDGVLNEVN